MGPLVPNIIGDAQNLIVALFVGIAFGFILEQAGFSSSRRLVGLFYGYDFVVLRVFFTAAITAMTGVILLSHFGLLNLDYVYINPTFLKSAILGGAIMGVGFVIGGFCPGTSVCASAIGKIDAMIYLFGIAVGMFIFAEVFPFVEKIYTGSYLGAPFVYEFLGIPRGWFAFLLIVAALAAFVVTALIENKVTGRQPGPDRNHLFRNVLLIGVSVLIGFLLIFAPDRKQEAWATVNGDGWRKQAALIPIMSVDELALRVINRDPKIQLIDVRNPEAFKTENIPTAINIPFDSLANSEWRDILKKKDRKTVFYAADQDLAIRACLLSRLLGDNPNSMVLEGGFEKFERDIIHYQSPATFTDRQARDTDRFRRTAWQRLEEVRALIRKKPKAPLKRRAVQGGC